MDPRLRGDDVGGGVIDCALGLGRLQRPALDAVPQALARELGLHRGLAAAWCASRAEMSAGLHQPRNLSRINNEHIRNMM
jgi:hypothetical protein